MAQEKKPFYTYMHLDMSFKLDRPYTTRDIAQLCDAIGAKTDNTIKVRPEPITEGGLEFVDWPGKTERMFKTMRFCVLKGDYGWPRITEDTYEKWKNPAIPEEVLFTPGEERTPTSSVLRAPRHKKRKACIEITFVLKAFHGAPCFTPSEISIVAQCLKNQGFTQHGRLPSKIKLISPGVI